MSDIYSITLSENELLFALVLFGVEDETKYEEYDLQIGETSEERIRDGKESLEKRDLVKKTTGLPVLDDKLTALVGATVVGEKQGREYVEEETGLHVWFVKDEGVYLFRGYVKESA